MLQFANETCVVCTDNLITTTVATTRTSESSEFPPADDHTSSSFTSRLCHILVPQIYSVYKRICQPSTSIMSLNDYAVSVCALSLVRVVNN